MSKKTLEMTDELLSEDYDFEGNEDVELVPAEEVSKATDNPEEFQEADEYTTDALQAFLRDVSRYDLLSPEEELKIANRIVEGDEKAKEIMIQSNLRLVIAIAKPYRKPDTSFLDLIQDGVLGLMKAADRFDPGRGYKFSTYATWWIRQSISRGIADTSRTIRMPVHIVEKFNKILRAQKKLFIELDRDPTHEEIGELIGMDPDEVERIITSAQTPASLDRPIGDDSEEDHEFKEYLIDNKTPGPDTTVFNGMRDGLLDEVLETLSFREREILTLRYGLDGHPQRTLEEIGRSWNITKERVRQIEVSSLEKLRKLSTSQSLKDFV